jgi:hypothetical protein
VQEFDVLASAHCSMNHPRFHFDCGQQGLFAVPGKTAKTIDSQFVIHPVGVETA